MSFKECWAENLAELGQLGASQTDSMQSGNSNLNRSLGYGNSNSQSHGPSPPTATPHELFVRNGIQQIQINLQAISEHLEQLERRVVSNRVIETLHTKLEETYAIIWKVENALTEWHENRTSNESSLSSEQVLRDKLNRHFRAEVTRVKLFASRIEQTAQTIGNSNDDNANYNCNNSPEASHETQSAPNQRQITVDEHSLLLERAMCDDETAAVARIQGDVRQANEAFQHMAVLTQRQGTALGHVEAFVEDTNCSAEQTIEQLKITHQAAARIRRRRALFYLVFLFCLATILWATDKLPLWFSPGTGTNNTNLSKSKSDAPTRTNPALK